MSFAVDDVHPRDFFVTFADGTKGEWYGVTRSVLQPGVLHLYRRPILEAAEEHLASVSLAQVRYWTKRESES